MEIVFGLKNQKSISQQENPEIATAVRTNGEHIKQLHARFRGFEEAIQTNRGRDEKIETQLNAIQDVVLSELGDPHKMESMKDLSRGPKLQIQVMPNTDDGKNFVTLSELRKYIMMAADEMSSTMKTYLDDKIDTMEHDLSDIRKEVKSERKRNEQLEARLHNFESQQNSMNGMNRRTNSGQYSPELVKKRSFDQLVKEVDQCFSELGRQVKREAKGRANIEEQLDQIQNNGNFPQPRNDPAMDQRIAKVEAALADLKKDTKKERKRIEKALEAQANSGPDMTAVEDTIQSIITDVVEELTTNEARLYESVERRMKDLEETVQSETTARSISERKANSELRRVSALVDAGKTGLRRNSSAEETTKTIDLPLGVDELRVTVASLKEQLGLFEEESAEAKRQFDTSSASFKKDLEEFRKSLHKTENNEREVARKIEKIEKGLVGAQSAAPGRTVSIGPDTGDVMSLKKQLKDLETKMDKIKAENEASPKSSLNDNKISPAIAKMNEQVNQVDADRNRLDNIRTESLGKIKAVREEVRLIKTCQPSSESKGPKVDVLVSQDVLKKADASEITKDDLERIFAKIEKLEAKNMTPGVSLGQTELMREFECLSDENQRLWRSLTKLEEEIKLGAKAGEECSDENSPGALANAINQFQKQIGTPDLTGELEIRLKKIERELSEKTDRGTDRLWRHLSNLEEQITRRHGENDERLSKLEAIPNTDSRENASEISVATTSESSLTENKNSQLWKEIGSLKAKMSEIIVISDSNREEWERTLITKDDMKEFEEKLNKFRDYWVAESSKYAKIGMLEIFTDDLSGLKAQVDDLLVNERGTVKALEDRMEILAEDLEENMTNARTEDRNYIERQLKTIEVNGVAAHVMEDLASLQHVVSRISAQLEMLKDTDASLTETPTVSEQTPTPYSEEQSAETSETASTVTQTVSLPKVPIVHAINKEAVIAEVKAFVEGKLKYFNPENGSQNEGLLKMVRERVSRLEDEVALARKEDQTNCDNLKRQIFALRDDLENRKPEFALPSVSSQKAPELAPIKEKLAAIEENNAVLEKSILSLVTKMDSKIDGIDNKCERTVKSQMALEEHVDNLEDRVTENQHGVTSVSTPSIPPAFFDLSPEIFDDKLELLTDKVKELMSDKKILSDRLDIVEEELETNDRFLIESISAEKAQEIAKRIAQSESKKLEEELKSIHEKFQNLKIDSTKQEPELKRNESEEIPKFIKSVSMGEIGGTGNLDYEKLIDEVKEIAEKVYSATKDLTFHDEMFDLVQKRLQALETHISELPLAPESSPTQASPSSEALSSLEEKLGDLEKSTSQNSKKSEKMSKELDDLRSKLKKNNNSLTRKLGDVEDEILSELAKTKILVESAKTHKEVQRSFDQVGAMDLPKMAPDVKTGSPISMQESFKLRNQIQDMWKSLRLDIAHRTANLEKLSKSELLNMRENLRQERKRTTKEITEVAEILEGVEKQVNFQRIDFEKEKAKETARRSMEMQKVQNQIRDSEKRMRCTTDAIANLVTEIRDEQADDRIYMRAELKQSQTEVRRQAMAFERIHGRQNRCENDMTDMNSKIKDLSRSFVNMATDSRATITNSFVKPSESRSELSTRAENSGLLNYRSSFTEFSTDRLSENSSNA
ncbi:Oidioi.mRNA.OKI2018_I69.chr2.g4129.t1.cds [Oikopleura dioica]|uniref:Oidioi.mRNA.OKI2018_I69.chr2.g4129.t1.cds n=1 Tax=Oikopleura dioica TaxID=34765 RepID=A0ABN7T1V1_OIKDI|nr:Oidioi.mRNA.OKI2018_I69.chr2.g4129.t1.cds [Oikopleura dioica]